VLRKMLEVVPRPSRDISSTPRMEALRSPAMNRLLIGPAGIYRGQQALYKVRISVVDDTGNIQVFGSDSKAGAGLCGGDHRHARRPRSARKGTIKSVRDFGPSSDPARRRGPVPHLRLAEGRGEVAGVVSIGDVIRRGRSTWTTAARSLSHKQALEPDAS
jgi:hypothetical protein